MTPTCFGFRVADLGNGQWRLEDLIGDVTYDRRGNDLQARGLYLDEPPWKACVFTLTKCGENPNSTST